MTLESNGKCTVIVGEDTEQSTWEESEKGFIVDGMEFVVDGDAATLD